MNANERNRINELIEEYQRQGMQRLNTDLPMNTWKKNVKLTTMNSTPTVK